MNHLLDNSHEIARLIFSEIYTQKMLLYFTEIPVFNANSADADQMPHSVVFDLGLHYLLMSLLGDSGHKWVN